MNNKKNEKSLKDFLGVKTFSPIESSKFKGGMELNKVVQKTVVQNVVVVIKEQSIMKTKKNELKNLKDFLGVKTFSAIESSKFKGGMELNKVVQSTVRQNVVVVIKD